MPKFTAVVLWNGNHYDCGQVVNGSEVELRPDGSTWLLDDEDVDWVSQDSKGNTFTFNECRNEWVQVDPETVKEREA